MAGIIKQSPYPVIVRQATSTTPYSYVYNTMKATWSMASKECGKGFMYTMREGMKRVRIDYIFHSERLKGSTSHKQEATYSDHLPVFMRLSL